MIYKSSSSEDTKKFAKHFAASLLQKRAKRLLRYATVVALYGDLGSGKTTFVKGFSSAFGVRTRVTSPTFILFRRFKVRHRGFSSMYHLDAYRIMNAKEFAALGVRAIMKDPQNIVLVEWPEKLMRFFPKQYTAFWFTHGKRRNERLIRTSRRF